MPRLPNFRNAIAAITMAVAALCGGGKAAVEQKGTLSVSEVRAAPALRSKSHKRTDDIVAVVSTTEAGIANDQSDEARAAGDDRAAPVFLQTFASFLGAVPTQVLPVHQIVFETVSHRPLTRAPPHQGIANRLADALGRA